VRLARVLDEVVELVVRTSGPEGPDGKRSPGRNGWRMTGTLEPGMRSSTARSSGFGKATSKAACTGMVDQRFDHIDSGALSCTGERE